MVALAIQLGLVLGLKHAVDADHVCTIASLLRTEGGLKGALKVAALWGLGHSVTFLGVGLVVVGLDVHLPHHLEPAADLLIAALLLWLGVTQWRHADCPVSAAPPPGRAQWRTALLGLVHGLAGSASISLLALTTMGTRQSALLFLALFGLATVAGMLLVTLALTWPLGALARRGDRGRVLVIRTFGGLSVVAAGWLVLRTLVF